MKNNETELEQSIQAHEENIFQSIIDTKESKEIQIKFRKKIYQIYLKNAKRLQILKAKYQQLSSVQIKKNLLKQLHIDYFGIKILPYVQESSQDDQYSEDIINIKKQYEQKQQIFKMMQAKYHSLQKVLGKMIVEKELNQNYHIRKAIKSIYNVHNYLYMTTSKTLIIYYTQIISKMSYIKFVPLEYTNTKTYQKILLQQSKSGVKLSKCQNFLLIIGTLIFEIYDITTQRLILKSKKHQSQIIYSEFYDQNNKMYLITVTKNRLVRLFNMQTKLLERMMICQRGQHFLLKQQNLYYSDSKILMEINLITKQIKSIKKFDCMIIGINQNSILTSGFCVNNYYQKIRQGDQLIQQQYQTLAVVTNKNQQKIQIQLRYSDKIIFINGQTYKKIQNKQTLKFICFFYRKDKQMLLFGEKNGELTQILIQNQNQ